MVTGAEPSTNTFVARGLDRECKCGDMWPWGELQSLYQSASVLLFPSLEEGFGIPVLEAMANGLPVVASRTASLPEAGGEAALYVDPHDPQDIADKVLRAVENPELRQKMIQQGLERAREFSWRRAAEATLKVYKEALSL